MDGSPCENEGGISNLKDPARISDVRAPEVPHLSSDPLDLFDAARLPQPATRDEYGSRCEELRQRLVVAQHARVFEQCIEFLRGSRSNAHDGTRTQACGAR